METNTNHTEQSGTKTTEKMMNDTSKELMDIFTKNLNVVTGFYVNLFSMVSKGMHTNTDWTEVAKKEEAIIENRLEAIKNMHHSIIESYNKQLDSVNKNNKKMMQETTDQFNLLMTQNQKIWTDVFSMNQTPLKVEDKIVKDPNLKDPILSEVKKPSAFPV